MTDSDFRAFLVNERQRLVHYVRSLIRETAEMEAEDIVHDVVMKVLERAELVPPERFQPAYIYRALRNRVIDRHRTAKNHLPIDKPDEEGLALADILADEAPGALEQLQTREGWQALFEALDRLSAAERDVITAHEFDGRNFKEIAAASGTPVNTLLARKRRGLQKLKIHLSTDKGESND